MKVKLHQHTGETKWKIEKFPRQTLWLAAALQACHIPAIYIPATWFFILHTPVWWHFLWITPASLLGSGEELLGFILLVRRHHRDAGVLITTHAAFGIQMWILLEKGGTGNGPGHRAATRWHAGLSLPPLALPGASYSRKAGRSSVELCKTPFLLTSIHPSCKNRLWFPQKWLVRFEVIVIWLK